DPVLQRRRHQPRCSRRIEGDPGAGAGAGEERGVARPPQRPARLDQRHFAPGNEQIEAAAPVRDVRFHHPPPQPADRQETVRPFDEDGDAGGPRPAMRNQHMPLDNRRRRRSPRRGHGATALVARRSLELIRLERAVIGYRTPLLPPLDLAVRAGTTLGVLGPNGAGKTALLKSLLGLLPLLGGRRILPHGRSPRVGYVPPRDRLDLSWPLTVLDVVLMGRTRLLGPLRRPTAVDRKRSR